MKSRRGLPKAFKEAKPGDFISLIPLFERRLKKGQKVFCQKKNVLALRWRDKRELWMLGTDTLPRPQTLPTGKGRKR
jgi:hypothetical protein